MKLRRRSGQQLVVAAEGVVVGVDKSSLVVVVVESVGLVVDAAEVESAAGNFQDLEVVGTAGKRVVFVVESAASVDTAVEIAAGGFAVAEVTVTDAAAAAATVSAPLAAAAVAERERSSGSAVSALAAAPVRLQTADA